jgi:hypothetical protein
MKDDSASIRQRPQNSSRRDFSRANGTYLQYGKGFERPLGYLAGILVLCFFCANIGSGATYYFDYASGSDTNNGNSKTTPWKRHPYMVGFEGSYAHVAGDRFIFKGGVTWPSSTLPLDPQAAGSGSINDYYGVDTNWYSGASFSRPILDGQYAVPEGIGLWSVPGNITIDNLEIAHINCTQNFGQGLIDGQDPSNVLIENCNLHGWTVTASTDDAHGGVIFSLSNPAVLTDTVQNTEIENSENGASGKWSGVCLRAVGTIKGCKIHDNSSAVLFCADFNGNELYNIAYPYAGFDPTYHFNGVYLDPVTLSATVGYIRNSFMHDISGGANMAYPNPHGYTIYVYNNVMYGEISAQQAIEIDPFGVSGSGGACYCWNNTIVVPSDNNNYTAIHVVNRGSSTVLSTLVSQNNIVIGASGVSVTDGGSNTVNNLTQSNNIVETSSQAQAQGYSLSHLYAPISSSVPTVGAGTNTPSKVFNTDISGHLRPQTGWDIGAYQYASSSAPPAAPSAPANLRIVTP